VEPRPGLLPLQVHRRLPRRRRPAPQKHLRQEEALLPGLDAWLGSLFDEDHLDDTCAALAGASEPDPEAEKREAQLRAAIADCDRKIRNYRQLLDDEDSVALAAQWIAETQRERRALERQLGQHIPGGELSAKEVNALVDALRDIVGVLAAADPADKSELYAQLGVSLSYDPTGNVTVKAEPRGVTVRVGGGTGPADTPTVRWALEVPI
jgi:hypothetical protein